MDNVKFTFTWRAQSIQKLPHIITLDEKSTTVLFFIALGKLLLALTRYYEMTLVGSSLKTVHVK